MYKITYIKLTKNVKGKKYNKISKQNSDGIIEAITATSTTALQSNVNTTASINASTNTPTTSKSSRPSRASKLPVYAYDVGSEEDDQIDYSPGEDDINSDNESTTEFKSPRGLQKYLCLFFKMPLSNTTDIYIKICLIRYYLICILLNAIDY